MKKICGLLGIVMSVIGSSAMAADPEILVATKTEHDEQFTGVRAALQTAITKVNSVVANTITQAGDIGTLATTKQTRPATNCANDKKCLLVKNPQQALAWYEIVDCALDEFLDDVGTKPAGTSSDMGYNIQGTNTDLCSASGVNCGNNEWVVQYGNGRVYGSAALVAISERGVGNIVTLDSANMPPAGNVCVCKVNGYSTGSNGVYTTRTNVTTNKWMVRDSGRAGTTLANCFGYCTRYDDATEGYNIKVGYYQNIANTCSAAAPNATACIYNDFFYGLYVGLSATSIDPYGVNSHNSNGWGVKTASYVWGNCDTGGDFGNAEPCAYSSTNPGAWMTTFKVTNSNLGDVYTTYNGAVVYGKARCVNSNAVFTGVADYSVLTLTDAQATASSSGTVCIHNITGYRPGGASSFTTVSSDDQKVWMVKTYNSAATCATECYDEDWPEDYFSRYFGLYQNLGDRCSASM